MDILVYMPTTKHAPVDDFAIDTAQLGDPLADDALDALDDILDARNAARDTFDLLDHMRQVIETGAQPYGVREQFAVDLEISIAALRRHAAAILGADGNA